MCYMPQTGLEGCATCPEQGCAPTMTSPKVLGITVPRHNTQPAPYSWTVGLFLRVYSWNPPRFTILIIMALHVETLIISFLAYQMCFFKRTLIETTKVYWRECLWSYVPERSAHNNLLPPHARHTGDYHPYFSSSVLYCGEKKKTLLSFAFLLLIIHHIYWSFFPFWLWFKNGNHFSLGELKIEMPVPCKG